MSTDAWPKQFSSHTPKWLAILIGVVFAGIGAVFLYGDFQNLRTAKPTGATWVGLGLATLGPLLAWAIYHFRTNIDLICNPDGFTLVKETRKGKTEEMYLWSDVTATKYWETTTHNKEKNTTTVTGYYEVIGPEGSLFQFADSLSKFPELVQTFNFYATGVPYLWEKQMGFNMSIAGFGMNRAKYAQVPRPIAAPQQPV